MLLDKKKCPTDNENYLCAMEGVQLSPMMENKALQRCYPRVLVTDFNVIFQITSPRKLTWETYVFSATQLC